MLNASSFRVVQPRWSTFIHRPRPPVHRVHSKTAGKCWHQWTCGCPFATGNARDLWPVLLGSKIRSFLAEASSCCGPIQSPDKPKVWDERVGRCAHRRRTQGRQDGVERKRFAGEPLSTKGDRRHRPKRNVKFERKERGKVSVAAQFMQAGRELREAVAQKCRDRFSQRIPVLTKHGRTR